MTAEQKVHVRIASPPIKYPDFYGIDMPSRKELLAANKNLQEMCKYIEASSLKFLSIDGLYKFFAKVETIVSTID